MGARVSERRHGPWVHVAGQPQVRRVHERLREERDPRLGMERPVMLEVRSSRPGTPAIIDALQPPGHSGVRHGHVWVAKHGQRAHSRSGGEHGRGGPKRRSHHHAAGAEPERGCHGKERVMAVESRLFRVVLLRPTRPCTTR